MNVTLDVEGVGPVGLDYSERGEGRPVLVLHGGAGPTSVVPWAELLARTRGVRAITPTHPGFAGTPRPPALTDIRGLSRVYAAFLDRLGLEGVTVVGNSVGGWIAAEIAALGTPRLDGLVLVDATGIEVPGHPVADAFALPLEEIRRRSYHDPARFVIDPSKVPAAQQAMMAGNFAALRVYAGGTPPAPLLPRLSRIGVPTLVAWGESDRVADPEYGRAYARAIPGATFRLLRATGHVPQIETPEALADVVGSFLAELAVRETSDRQRPREP
jgi:pimeloyl-ACP methyl ester carboxylesterase